MINIHDIIELIASKGSLQELFWQTLCGEDLVLARSTGCGSPQELEMEKKKKEERRLKAEKTQQSDLWKNEKRRRLRVSLDMLCVLGSGRRKRRIRRR